MLYVCVKEVYIYTDSYMNKNKLYTELCIITPVLTYIWGGFVLLVLCVWGNTRKHGGISTSNSTENKKQYGRVCILAEAITETMVYQNKSMNNIRGKGGEGKV